MATVTMATVRRVAGVRAASSTLTPSRTRPRRSRPRPAAAATGTVACASSIPTTRASSAGAARAIGPVEAAGEERDDGRAGTPPAPASPRHRGSSPHAATAPGAAGSRPAPASPAVRRAASASASTTAAASVGQHRGRPDLEGSGAREEQACERAQQSTPAATTPSGTPASVTGSSSRSSSVAGAGPAASPQQGQRHLRATLLGRCGQHEPQHDDREQPELEHQQRDGHPRLRPLGTPRSRRAAEAPCRRSRPGPVVAAFFADRSTSSIRGPSSSSWSIPVAATSRG